mmetsp:Transcript_12746/g.19074  ORF Transcript_12746/g.19074 Transcript_12746/m.19074 type:complete len:90 (-) Transcript_12746:48-317(-)
MLHILLHSRIRKPPSDHSLSVEHCIGGIHSDLIFRRITNETFSISKRYIGWSGSVSLIIGYDLNTIILPYSDAGISCSEINTYALTIDR